MLPIDKATGNIAPICKQFYVSVIANKIGLGSKNATSVCNEINNTSKDEIINNNIEKF